MVTMRHGASLPWSGVRSASAMMSCRVAASGPGATMSRALPERRVARCERSEAMPLNMAAHVGVFAPRRQCCVPFAINLGVTGVFRAADGAADVVISEERRAGQEGVSTGRYGWGPDG